MDEPLEHAAPYEVVVVGAGAAGLLAATRSAERGRRTLLLEKNRKPGVKILMSGGTRCNITHACDERGIIDAFGAAGRFLHSPLAALGPQALVDLLHAEGLSTKTEPTGKIFPQSDRAADVLEALLRRLRRSGAELSLGEGVAATEMKEGRFLISSASGQLEAARLIITTGGKSYPGCGTAGDGYRWLAAWGHTIRPPRPALVPLTSDEAWLHELAGVTVADVRLRVVDVPEVMPAREPAPPRPARRRRSLLPPGVRIERRGSLLFTHFGLSGPVVLDVSRAVTAAKAPRLVRVVADFLPDIPSEALEEQLRQGAAADGKSAVVNLVGAWLPRRLAAALLARAGLPLDRRGAELSKEERRRLVEQLNRCEISITGSRGFDKAEVTAGGVALEEVDSRTMQSKLVPNLFLAGEILDLDGFIGGYNFQAAFSTGYLAGESV